MPRWEPQKLRPVHETVVDLLITNPAITNIEIARHLGYTPEWVGILINSDAFQHRLAQRRKEMIDPLVTAQINEMMDVTVKRSLAKVADALAQPGSERLALDVLKATGAAARFGARTKPSPPAEGVERFVAPRAAEGVASLVGPEPAAEGVGRFAAREW